MKRLIIITLLALSAAVSAQSNTGINATITGLKAGQWVYCRTFDESQKDSVKSLENEFHFKLNIPPGEGNIYLLQIGKGYKDNNATLVYLDKGVVTIKGNGPGFKDAKLSGTASIKDYNDYNDFFKNSPQLKGREELYKNANDLYAKHDTVALKALQPQLDFIDSVNNALAKQWVSGHPASPVSAYILSRDLRYSLSMDELEQAMNKLAPAAKNNIPAKTILHSIATDKLTGIGKTAFNFTQTDTLGKAVSLTDFRGKYVLVDFWASWCVPCRAENPNVVKAFNTYKEKNFTILSISFDQAKENWLKAIQKDSLAWSHVSDLKGWNNAVGKQYDISSIPANILIDPDGKILAKNLHGEELMNKLQEVLK